MTTVTVKNSQGQVLQVTDNNGGIIAYQYDPYGNLVMTKDPGNNRITASFDRRGRQIALSDPDLGTRIYSYDGFGQLLSATDAKQQRTDYTYDQLGRMLTRTEFKADGAIDLKSIWLYDSGPMSRGKLAKVSTTAGYEVTFAYDSLGRPSTSRETLEAGIVGDTTRTYDPVTGRVTGIVTASQQGFVYEYNALGYLSKIFNASGGMIWQVKKMSAAGGVTEEFFGNNITTLRTFDRARGVVTSIKSKTAGATGNDVQSLVYEYDAFLNLLKRDDQREKVEEAFTYDKLNRLIDSSAAKYNTTPLTTMSQHSVRYDMLGNITSKDDVGAYTYGGGAGPHAVTSIAGPGAGIFLYDQNGNMKEGNGRTLEWTSFNMPASITKGNVSIGFSYGPEHQRIKQTKPGETIYYFAGGVELVVNTASNLRTWTNYVSADGRLVGSLTRASTDALNASIPAYYHLDHLGSLDRITDQWGTVIEKLDFDAWGKRRWANGSDDAQGLIPPSSARRGFTGHEQLDNVGLVHMNGRIYDPVIARFLSADPTVQAPYNLQSFNRYSYVQNNPLSYTDPTGFSIFSNLIKGITNFLVGLVKGAIKRLTSLDYWLDVLETAAYAINPALGVAFSAIRGAITTGSLDGTIKYTLMSAFQHASAFMGAGGGSFSGDPSAGGGAGWKGSGGGFGSEWLPDIMGKWLPDAAAAGFSLADGAKDYKANLASAGAGQLGGFGGAARPAIQFARAKSSGGTATALGNAKFSNGAGSGAFIYAGGNFPEGPFGPWWGKEGAPTVGEYMGRSISSFDESDFDKLKEMFEFYSGLMGVGGGGQMDTW